MAYPTKLDAERFKSNADLVNEIVTSTADDTTGTDENSATKKTLQYLDNVVERNREWGTTTAETWTPYDETEGKESLTGLLNSAHTQINEAISNAGVIEGGVYAVGIEFTDYNYVYTYATDGTKWKVKATVTVPYIATETDPNDDTNLRLFNEIDERKAVSITQNTELSNVALLFDGAVGAGEEYWRDVPNQRTYFIAGGITGTVTNITTTQESISIVTGVTTYAGSTIEHKTLSVISDLLSSKTNFKSVRVIKFSEAIGSGGGLWLLDGTTGAASSLDIANGRAYNANGLGYTLTDTVYTQTQLGITSDSTITEIQAFLDFCKGKTVKFFGSNTLTFSEPIYLSGDCDVDFGVTILRKTTDAAYVTNKTGESNGLYKNGTLKGDNPTNSGNQGQLFLNFVNSEQNWSFDGMHGETLNKAFITVIGTSGVNTKLSLKNITGSYIGRHFIEFSSDVSWSSTYNCHCNNTNKDETSTRVVGASFYSVDASNHDNNFLMCSQIDSGDNGFRIVGTDDSVTHSRSENAFSDNFRYVGNNCYGSHNKAYGLNNSSAGHAFEEGTGIVVDSLFAEGCVYNYRIKKALDGNVTSNLRISNSESKNAVTNGVNYQGGNRSTISGMRAYGSGNHGFYAVSFEADTDNLTLIDSEFYDNGATVADSCGIYMRNDPTYNLVNTTLKNNECYDTRDGASRTQEIGIRHQQATGIPISEDNKCYNNLTQNFDYALNIKSHNDWDEGNILTFGQNVTSPVGTQTPRYIGQIYHVYAVGGASVAEIWQAVGVTSNDWLQIG